MPNAAAKLTFCLAEDRKGAETGIKLAILSLARRCAATPVVLFRPKPIPELTRWLERFPQVQLKDEWPEGALGWDCKPQALLRLVDANPHSEVVRLDSDIIVSRDPRPLFAAHPAEALIISGDAAHQPHSGTALRTTGWNLPLGRSFPNTFYSCVIRVNRHHRALLLRWRELLEDPRYLSARNQQVEARPLHLQGDQDALNALIGSAEFDHIAVHELTHGRDILHTGGALGFSMSQRMRGLFQPAPMFLHAIGSKPWVLLNPRWQAKDLAFRHRRLQQELSEYVAQARSYRRELDEPTEWMDFSSPSGASFRMLGLGNWALRGLPLTLAATLYASARGTLKH